MINTAFAGNFGTGLHDLFFVVVPDAIDNELLELLTAGSGVVVNVQLQFTDQR